MMTLLAVKPRFIALLCLVVAGAAWAQEGDGEGAQIQMNTPGGSMNINVQGMGGMKSKAQKTEVIESSGDGYKLKYETNPQDDTIIRVLEPEGFFADVWDEGMNMAHDTIPMSTHARSGKFMRIVITDPNSSATWEKKLEAKGGMTMSLWVTAPRAMPAQAPVSTTVVVRQPPARVVVAAAPTPAPASPCMPTGDLSALKSAIENESFREAKVGVLEQAAGSASFCVDQVAQLVDLYDFREDKVKAVELTRAHLVDRQNGFKLISHFDFQDDKAKVKEMLK